MYELLSFVRRSKIKGKMLNLLLNEPMTSTDLKKALNIHRESASRALIEMEERGLVECITPKEPNFRYYKITKKGKRIVGLLDTD